MDAVNDQSSRGVPAGPSGAGESRNPAPGVSGCVSPRNIEKHEAAGMGARAELYFMLLPPGSGMSELKMSHWVCHFPFIFSDTSIHLPWSRCEPSAPVTT